MGNEIEPKDLFKKIEYTVKREIVPKLQEKCTRTAQKVGLMLRNNTIQQFNGPKSGNTYKVKKVSTTESGKKKVSVREYRASAPGESPAIRTGNLKKSFQFRNTTHRSHNGARVESETYSNVRPADGPQYNYAWLDKGIGKIAPRPYSGKALMKTVDQYERLLKRI